MKKDRWLLRSVLLLALSALLMTTALAAEAGSTGDPLVTLSYLNETFFNSIMQRVDQKIAQRNGQLNQIGDGFAADPDVEGLLAQARTAALGAYGLARVTGLHYAELDFAPFAVDVVEEGVQSVEIFVSAPQQPFLFRRQGVEGCVDRELEFIGVAH